MIYLASPYSHPDEAVRLYRFHEAARAAAKLMLAGYAVYSPICHSHPIDEYLGDPQPWDFWRKQDLWHLRRSTLFIVLTLDGWDSSVGVGNEIRAALEKRMSICYWDGTEASLKLWQDVGFFRGED